MNLKSKLLSISASMMVMMLMLSTANAWDGFVVSQISSIDFVGGASGTPNQDVRVFLVGGAAICTGGTGNWGYINTVDPNYQTLVSALLVAKTNGSQVTLLTVKDSNGYCHIGYLSIS